MVEMDRVPGYEALQLPAGGGIFAVYSMDKSWQDAPFIAAQGAQGNQNRGESVTHMATLGTDEIMTVSGDRGLASRVYTDKALNAVRSYAALVHVSHNAHKMAEGTTEPHYSEARGREFSLSFDGAVQLGAGERFTGSAQHLAEHLTAYLRPGVDTSQAVFDMAQNLTGAFSLAVLDGGLTVARDPSGVHPLHRGYLEEHHAYAYSSDSIALFQHGAVDIREVTPGTVETINAQGHTVRKFANPKPGYCAYNFLHTARRGGEFGGKSIEKALFHCGQLLGEQDRVEADIVVRVPERAGPIALGYARARDMHYSESALQRSRYDYPFASASRNATLSPVQRKRASLAVVKGVFEGKRVVAVDDSSGVGTTGIAVAQLLFEAGAAEVHYRSASPPRQESCTIGGGDGTVEDLLAAGVASVEIRQHMKNAMGVDSYDYLNTSQVARGIGLPLGSLCLKCVGGSGPYPEASQILSIRGRA